MLNISTKGEDLILETNEWYIVIDGYYLSEITEFYQDEILAELDKEVKQKVFPYCDTPFAKIFMQDAVFSVDSIKEVHPGSQSNSTTECQFSSDTGLIVLVKESLIGPFAKGFEYDELVDTSEGLINLEYWQNHISEFDQYHVGLIVAPGIESQFEFAGSGTYEVRT